MNKVIIGDVELHLCDCMDYMRGLPDGAFDLAIVDPPYGIGMDNQHKRTKPNRPNSYTDLYKKVKYTDAKWDSSIPQPSYFKELERVSKAQIIWGANYFCTHLTDGCGWIYWDKQMGENNFSSGEFAYQSLQTKSNSFSFPSDRSQSRIHPTQKPVELYEWLLSNYAKPGQRILDTHLGSGSSAIAAKNLGYEFVGCELDADYFAAACERITNAQRQEALFAPMAKQEQEALL